MRWVRLGNDDLTRTPEADVINAMFRNKSDRALIVSSMLCLTMHIARRLTKKDPTSSDDITSEALLALVEFVDQLLVREVDEDFNHYAYLTKCIELRVKDFIISNRVIRIPPRTMHLKIKEGALESLNNTVDVGTDVISDVIDISRYKLTKRQVAINSTPETDLRDIINRVVEDDCDRKIIEMQIAGHSNQEISEQTGMHPDRLKERKKVLYRNIRRRL